MTDSGLEMMDQMNVTRPPKAGDYEGYWATFYRASNLCLNANGRGGREVCDCTVPFFRFLRIRQKFRSLVEAIGLSSTLA